MTFYQLLPESQTSLENINITVTATECKADYIVRPLSNCILRMLTKDDEDNVTVFGYFFNECGIYSCKKITIPRNIYYHREFNISTAFSPVVLFLHQTERYRPSDVHFINNIRVRKEWMHTTISTLKLGDTWLDLFQRYNILVKTDGAIRSFRIYYPSCITEKDIAGKNSDIVFSMSQPDIELVRFLTYANEPIIERDTDNPNQNTFDFIRVRFGILSKTACPNRIALIKSYRQDISKIAINKIQSFRQFQSYNVPINCLKLNHIAITMQNELELLFVLKNITHHDGVVESDIKCF